MNKETRTYGVEYILVLALFLIVTFWWLALKYFSIEDSMANEYFSVSYGLMALFGGLYGLKISKKWGGISSFIGKTIISFSIGLLLQEFGQLAYSFYSLFLGIEIPYPSIGDIGFFGSIPFYLLGTYYLSKAVGIEVLLKDNVNKLIFVLVPVISVIFVYYMFLVGYEYDWSQPVTVFLDFGYPIGQSLYVSLGLSAYILSSRFLGGYMRVRVLLLFAALVIQYCADFYFLYLVSRDLWDTAGINEYMYFFAYFVMTLSILEFNSALKNIKNGGLNG